MIPGGSSPHTSGIDPGCHQEEQEGPVLCEVDLALDPRAVSPYLVTSGVHPCCHEEEQGPTFQEGPVLCEVDFAHDPKAYLAEQVYS